MKTKDLSTPELLVLLNPTVEAREALKVGFKKLIAMGLVHLGKISRHSWLGFKVTGTELHLSAGKRPKTRFCMACWAIFALLAGMVRSLARYTNNYQKSMAQTMGG